MTTPNDQFFESYVPVYDVIPETWEEGRQFLVEQLKKMSNAINIRAIGWYLDQELLSGKQFFPGTSTDSQEFRSILRVVVDFSPLAIGTTGLPHNVTVDSNFSLINLWGAATDAVALTGTPINQPNIYYDSTNIYIVSTAAYDRAYAVMEYMQEL